MHDAADHGAAASSWCAVVLPLCPCHGSCCCCAAPISVSCTLLLLPGLQGNCCCHGCCCRLPMWPAPLLPALVPHAPSCCCMPPILAMRLLPPYLIWLGCGLHVSAHHAPTCCCMMLVAASQETSPLMLLATSVPGPLPFCPFQPVAQPAAACCQSLQCKYCPR